LLPSLYFKLFQQLLSTQTYDNSQLTGLSAGGVNIFCKSLQFIHKRRQTDRQTARDGKLISIAQSIT